MTKAEILNSIHDLPVEELFEHIKNAKVTLEDLMGKGLNRDRRLQIQDLQKNEVKADEEAWSKAEFGEEEDLLAYIKQFPNGLNVNEAKRLVRAKREEEERKQRAKYEILENIENKPNYYSRADIKQYLKNKTISKTDLLDRGVPEGVVDLLDSTPVAFDTGETPESIPKGYTEVYFWGVPGSGKTCALSAVLSKAAKDGNLEYDVGPGFHYMVQLTGVFSEDNAVLPNPTPFDKTQYLPFAIRESSSKVRSISLIELSGELFETFYTETAGLPPKSPLHKETFDILHNYLKSDNRKIHFFFIDYQKGNKKNHSGLTQSNYLDAAAIYFKNNKIFSKSTDAIYVVLTKSDLMDVEKEEWVEEAKKHLKNENFSQFTNSLKAICEQNSINSGKLYVEPFSVGKTYFNNLCSFDDTSAGNILEILKKRIPARGKSMFDFFNK